MDPQEESALVATLRHTLSADDAERGAAEQRYHRAKEETPGTLVAGLCAVLASCDIEQAVRESAAVLLRQCLTNANRTSSTWSQLGATAQAELQVLLLQVLQAETEPRIRRKTADCIQTLGNDLVNIPEGERPANCDGWPGLLPLILSTVVDSGRDAGLRTDCLWIMREMASSLWPVLLASAAQVCEVFCVCLDAPVGAVRGEAVSLLCALVGCIPSQEARKPFQVLVPRMISVVADLARAPDSEQLDSVLQSFQATWHTVDFFKAHAASGILPVMSQIAKSHPGESSKKYALEVIVSFLESKPKSLLKATSCVTEALDVSIGFMKTLSEDAAAWSAREDEEDGDDEELHVFGKEAVNRICCAAHKADRFQAVLELLKPAITALFQSQDWKDVVAAVSTLAQISEYLEDEATVAQMLQVVTLQLSANHPHVRYTAWGAIAQLAEDHSELVSGEAWTSQLLPLFLGGLDDPCLRTSLRSMQAFQYYGEVLEREDLEPCIQALMTRLFAKLEKFRGHDLVLQRSITFIAVIARQVEEAFAPYYATLVPLLKQVVADNVHKVEERTLLGKCFECLSLLAKAIGSEGFRPDAELIMEAMVRATQVPDLPSSDPVKEYMMAACERICSTMKRDFLPFVPHVLPGILGKLTLAPQGLQRDGVDDLQAGQDVSLTVTRENGRMKVMVMYSSDMQDLRAALECLHTFVEELGPTYGPYVAATAEALLPVFDFSMGEDIRDLAFETWGQLCACTREAGAEETVGKLLLEFLKRTLPQLETDEVDFQALKTRVDGVTTCLRRAGPRVLGVKEVHHLCALALKLVEESLKRREAARAEESRQQEEDEEADEEDDDCSSEEQSLRVSFCEVAGALMQHYPEHFVSEGLPGFLLLVQRLVQSGGTEDRKLALFISCDFLEHLGSAVIQQWSQFLPLMLQELQNEEAEVRQPACYGLSLAAKQPAFAAFALEAAGKLAEVVTQSRARGKKRQEKLTQGSADNALSALVEILLSQSAAIHAGGPEVESQLWAVWLAGLPCQADEQEGAKNHRTLLRLLQEQSPHVVGEGGQNVPRLLAILVDLYKTDMVDDATSAGIGALVLQAQPAHLEQCAKNYTPKQRKRLARIAAEAQKQPAVR